MGTVADLPQRAVGPMPMPAPVGAAEHRTVGTRSAVVLPATGD
jgi:hypothetical protein